MSKSDATASEVKSGVSAKDVTDTVNSLRLTYARDSSAVGVVVADGMGLRLYVKSGGLIVEDGMGEHRRTRRFDRATHGMSRLVVLGTTGLVSLDALNWCRRLGIAVVMLAPEGSPVLSSTPRMTDDARLRRMQAKAPDEPIGLDLARWLLSRKLTAQAQLLASRFEDHDPACTIADLASAIDCARTIEEARGLEAAAASLYWQSWSGRPECVPVFAAKDRGRIPAHWTRYEGRRSVLASGNGNRKAERPVNGLLNYTYALLEAEAILACQVVGLDPGLGIVHNDTRGRQSLALDLIEPVRPEVDAFVLNLLESRTFRKVEFIETPDGHCRLRAPLSHDLAETMPMWARSLAPIAEHVAHALGQAMAGKYVASTPLTTRRHRSAQAAVKARKAAGQRAASSSTVRQMPARDSVLSSWTCPDCGGRVANHRHVRCDACISADFRQTPELRGRRGAAIASRKRTQREWEEANPGIQYDPAVFAREIRPLLKGIPLADIAKAADFSKAYASDIRSGRYTPHVSTWGALAALVGLDIPPVMSQ